ncbi:MAG TPA: hypothetical protein VNX65_03600 [Patescibacteria group bacterium]|nr:hypothetical protein [Patescibacteria group bacterium]
MNIDMLINIYRQHSGTAFKAVFRYLIMGFCGLITLFVFASSYSTTFNRPLMFIDAVSNVDLRPFDRFLQSYKPEFQTEVGNYGKPQYLKLPSQKLRMILAPAAKVNGQFVARANAGHYAITSSPKNGNLGDTIIYYRKSWRTNDRPQRSKIGDNIFIDTDRGWRYFYRIDETKTIAVSAPYIARSTPAAGLLLAAVDSSAGGTATVAHATLVNVQNVQQ